MVDQQLPPKSSLSINEARIAGLYDLKETIGRGHYAVVKLARHAFTGQKVAVKVIDKSKLDQKMHSHLIQEVRCMKLVQHPNIVRLYEVIDTNTKLFLVLELGDCDMYEFMMKNPDKGCPEPEAQQYFCQIMKAIDYCHKLHVVHRDLKPENVVFFKKFGMVKLTDFGFSNRFTPGEQLATACGSLAYSAPEILLGDAYDAPAVDVWSVGVILYMLLCGRLPFQEANESETLTKILDCNYVLPEYISHSARYLISRMLVKDVNKRATVSEIMGNPWILAGERSLDQVLPLIEHHMLSENVHEVIVERMVAGGVATEEEIYRSLVSDDYSYNTATYYLLAEWILSAQREERAQEVLKLERQPFQDPLTSYDGKLEEEPVSGESYKCRSRSNSCRGGCVSRAWSVLKEESEDELSTYLKLSRPPSRNSSSVFNVTSGSREKITSEAIQDLLDFPQSNLSRSRRRTASSDSRISSRSSSSPNSSGRISPVVRFKSALPITGGLRKLSSSPHLLGICEESEDIDSVGGAEAYNSGTKRSASSSSNAVYIKAQVVPTVDGHASTSGNIFCSPVTYCKVRMIRPRQAKVSPDMAKRYEIRIPNKNACYIEPGERSISSVDAQLNPVVSESCKKRSTGVDRNDGDFKGDDARMTEQIQQVGFSVGISPSNCNQTPSH